MNKLKTLHIFLVSMIFVAVSLHAKPTTALVRSIKGYAEYAAPGSELFKPLQPSLRLKTGTTIKTHDDSTVILRVVPGAAMRISPNTVIKLDEILFEEEAGKVKQRKATISLSKGTVSSLLKKKESKVTDFRIQTPQGAAAARGTFYGVTVEDGQTFISVKEGKVGLKLKEEESQ